MSDRQFERAVQEWLEDGSDRTPTAAIQAVLFAVKTTPQQRDLGIPRRFTLMPAYLRYAAAVAIVAIVGVGVLALNSRSPSVGNETPIPTLSPSGTPAAPVGATSPPSETANWIPFTSSRYGYSIAYPPTDWTAFPGDHDWSIANDIDAFNSTAPDRFQNHDGAEPDGGPDGKGIRVSVWSDSVGPGTTFEDWFDAFCAAEGSCPSLGPRFSSVQTGDGHAGVLWHHLGFGDHPTTPVTDRQPIAFFLVGQKVYVAAVWRRENDPRMPWGGANHLLSLFLSTMTLTAETSAE